LDRCYAHEIKSVADAIVEQGLDKLGYQYVNMDDCWSATSRDSNGQLQVAFPFVSTYFAEFHSFSSRILSAFRSA
jgi:hypothetical protein